jgi:O-antigen/teichoic acid export membrane protein
VSGPRPISKTRAFAYLWSARLIGSILGLISVPLYLRIVGADVFGAFVTASAAAAFVGLLDFGFTPAAVRRMTEEYEKGETGRFWVAYRTNVMLYLGATLMICLVVALVTGHVAFDGARDVTQSRWLFALAAFAVVFQLLNLGLRSFLQGSGDFATLARLDVLGMVLNSLSGIVGVWMTHDPRWIPGGIVLGTGTAVAVTLLIATRRGAWRRIREAPSFYREYFSFALKTLANRIVAFAVMNGERLLIAAVVTPREMANLDTASRGPMAATTTAMSMHDPITRGLTAAQVAGGGAFGREFSRLSLQALVIGLVLIAVPCAFAEPLLTLWLGPQRFEGGAFVMVMVASFWASMMLNIVLGNSCYAWSQPNLILPFSVAQAAFILGLVYPATVHYGLAGAAVVKLASQVTVIPMVYMICRRFAPEIPVLRYYFRVGRLHLAGAVWVAGIYWMCKAPVFVSHPWLCLPLIPIAMALSALSVAHLRLAELPAPIHRALAKVRLAPRAAS